MPMVDQTGRCLEKQDLGQVFNLLKLNFNTRVCILRETDHEFCITVREISATTFEIKCQHLLLQTVKKTFSVSVILVWNTIVKQVTTKQLKMYILICNVATSITINILLKL